MPTRDQRLSDSIRDARAGKTQDAKGQLIRLLKEDQQDETAWFWLAACCDTVKEKQLCLEKALAVNPNNERTRQALKDLNAFNAFPSVPSPEVQEQSDVEAQHNEESHTQVNKSFHAGASALKSSSGQPDRRWLWVGLIAAFFLALLLVGSALLKPGRQQANLGQRAGTTVSRVQPTRTYPPTWTPRPGVQSSTVTPQAPQALVSGGEDQAPTLTESETLLGGEALDYMPRLQDLPEGYAWVPELARNAEALDGSSMYFAGYRFGNTRLLQFRITLLADTTRAKREFKEEVGAGGLTREMALHTESSPLDIGVLGVVDEYHGFELAESGTTSGNEAYPVQIVIIRYKNLIGRVDVRYVSGDVVLGETEYYARVLVKRVLER